jgi:hypothetical protein
MIRDRAFWTLLVLTALLPAGRVTAQESGDPRWLPWLGCWQPIENGVVAAGEEEAAAPQAYFCVRPSVGGVEIATVVDGAAVSSRTMVADGARHEVSEEGCRGWQSARWSEDGQRLFVSSEVLCEGGVTRTASGLMAMVSPSEWIDAHAIGMGSDRTPRAVRYRPAPTTVAEQAGFDLQTVRYGFIADARRLAASPLSVEDVTEATEQVDALAVEAFLFERAEGFELDAARITELADAGVPENVIDLMVALSYPARFSMNREAMSGEFRPEEVRPDRYAPGYYGRDRYWDYCYGRGFYSYCSPYGYMPLGWSYGYYNPYFYGGYGYGGYGWGYGRPVIVVGPGGEVGTPAGRAVKGKGYTRTDRGTALSGGSSSGRSAAGSGSSGGSVGRSGGSSGGTASGSTGSTGSSSSGGRTAKRRGGGQ